MSDDPTRQPGEHEDLVPEDDAIIGRVFRRSLIVAVIAALLVIGGVWLTRRGSEAEQAIVKDVEPIADLTQATDEMPQVVFSDVTAAAGIDFVHVNGARGEKLLPETMGGGAAFFDLDRDDDQDLLLIGGEDRGSRATPAKPSTVLYRNDGAGKFVDISAAAGLQQSFYAMGAAVADYDNDGDPDLFVTAVGANRLLRNDAGRFVDVTDDAGVAGSDTAWSSSAGFFDYDNDGDLDLFVCNYVRWSREIDIELDFSLNGTDRAYGPPTNYEGTYPYLYRNNGDGTFEDVSAQAGVQVVNPLTAQPMGKALAVSFADIDRDGAIDILVANDTVQNFLFRNRGDGTFEELGAVSGFGFDGAGNATGAMGIDAAYYRNDAQFGVGIANFANEMTSLYVAQREPLQFTDETVGEGIGAPSRLYLSFGLFFFDYDQDGRLDLLQANGHLEDEINQVQASQHYRQPAQLFWNRGPDARSCFAEVPQAEVGALSEPLVGRGASYADIDGDGDLDVLLTQAGGAPRLLRNEQQLGHHWLRVRLRGTRCNADAIGAWVELSAAGTLQRRQLMPTRSYLSQVEGVVTFGLGTAERIDSLRVRWPDGSQQSVDGIEPDRLITIVQD